MIHTQIKTAIKHTDANYFAQVLGHIICTGSFMTGLMSKLVKSSPILSKLWNRGIPASLSMSISSRIDTVISPLRA